MVYLLSQALQTVEVKLLSTADYVKNHSRQRMARGSVYLIRSELQRV